MHKRDPLFSNLTRRKLNPKEYLILKETIKKKFIFYSINLEKILILIKNYILTHTILKILKIGSSFCLIIKKKIILVKITQFPILTNLLDI